MTLLIPLGFWGVQHYLLPIFGFILTLLTILYFSYRQTIVAYPNGGGSFTVASENLGDRAGLFAAAALMIDYILTAAVGISAGVTALVSAFQQTKYGPMLHQHQLLMCLLILVAIALVNMRGVKETGAVFMLPTFLFVGTLLTTIGVGVFEAVMTHGHPIPHWSAAAAGGQSDDQAGGMAAGVSAAEGVLQWLRGDDGCGSGVERRDGVQGAAQRECEPHADGDYRDSDHPAVWLELCGASVWRDGDGPGRYATTRACCRLKWRRCLGGSGSTS